MRSFVSNNISNALHLASICLAAVLSTVCHASTWFVDSSATGTNNGTSWSNAWTALSQISGVSPGDTVYISGGPSGSSQTYSVPTPWTPVSGSSGNRITYQIGQDSAHNGTATFSCTTQFINAPVHDINVLGDAGDGNQHFLFSALGQTPFDVSGSSNTHFSYFNCPASTNAAKEMVYMNGGSGLEIDHVYYYKWTSSTDDNIGFLLTRTAAWDDSKIHDCEFHAPHSTASGQNGWGDDFFNGNPTNGVSIYNCRFISYGISNYLAGQHQDGWQPLSGSYLKFYNNYLENITNYAFFGDAYSGNFTHVWVYNNIAVLSDPIVQSFAGPAGYIIGVDGGSSGTTFTDVIIVNNLIDGYQQHQGIALNNVTSHSGTFVNCVVANNTLVNGGSVLTQGNTTSTVINNVSVSAQAAPGDFASYAANSNANDYHLKGTAGGLLAAGANYSSYFTIDADGLPRQQSGNPWDIGPYRF
jgi:hypothetical protein